MQAHIQESIEVESGAEEVQVAEPEDISVEALIAESFMQA